MRLAEYQSDKQETRYLLAGQAMVELFNQLCGEKMPAEDEFLPVNRRSLVD